MAKKLIEGIDSGEITEGDVDRKLGEMGEPARERWLRYCQDNCGVGTCALEGFGFELVGADYDTLNDVDKARYNLYLSIDVSHYITKITLGVAL